MTVTERDLLILRHLRRYKFLSTAQIRKLVFPKDADGSTTRDRLRKLEGAGHVSRRRAEVAVLSSSTIPVWMITEEGACALAMQLNDTRLLLDNPYPKAWQSLAHWLAVSDVHIKLDQAIANQDRVRLHDVFFEHDIVNPEADDPSQRFKLHVTFHEPKRLSCSPDSAFEIQVGDFRRAFYTELERGSDSPHRAIARKYQGHFQLHRTGAFKRHFPQAQDMRVIAFAPNPSWRDAMRKAARKRDGAELWLFCASNELAETSFLDADIFWPVDGGPRPFIRPVAIPAAGVANMRSQPGGATGT